MQTAVSQPDYVNLSDVLVPADPAMDSRVMNGQASIITAQQINKMCHFVCPFQVDCAARLSNVGLSGGMRESDMAGEGGKRRQMTVEHDTAGSPGCQVGRLIR